MPTKNLSELQRLHALSEAESKITNLELANERLQDGVLALAELLELASSKEEFLRWLQEKHEYLKQQVEMRKKSDIPSVRDQAQELYRIACSLHALKSSLT